MVSLLLYISVFPFHAPMSQNKCKDIQISDSSTRYVKFLVYVNSVFLFIIAHGRYIERASIQLSGDARAIFGRARVTITELVLHFEVLSCEGK